MSERCPRCGSDRVKPERKQRRCEDCGFFSTTNKFSGLTIEYPRRIPNQHWRDPVAMGMDDYEDDS